MNDPQGPPSGAGRPSVDERRSAHARQLIRDRFGDALDSEDVEALIPYVVQILIRSQKLAARVSLPSTDSRTAI